MPNMPDLPGTSQHDEEQQGPVPRALDVRGDIDQSIEDMPEGPAKEFLLQEKKVMESAALAYLQPEEQKFPPKPACGVHTHLQSSRSSEGGVWRAMEAEGSLRLSTHTVEVAQAILEKHKDHILKLRAHVDAAMKNLGTMNVDFWKLEGASLMRSMQDVSRGLTALETSAGITNLAGMSSRCPLLLLKKDSTRRQKMPWLGGTAAVVGGALSIAECVLSGPVIPLALSVPALPLGVAAAVLGTFASFTSAGTDVSTVKLKLEDLHIRYDAICREAEQLQQILTEILSLLDQLSQVMSLMFGSLELVQGTDSKALKLQELSCVERMWVLDLQNPSVEGLVLNAVGVIEQEGADVKMTRIGKAVAALRKNSVDMAQLKLPSLEPLRCENPDSP
ncbi:hypothetical protein L7F22_006048 [Adiantum nelumboides]|nr:hypothetical protein [Adiantum nelumboides]